MTVAIPYLEKERYVGTGSRTAFSFGYRVFEREDVAVILGPDSTGKEGGRTLSQNSDYLVTLDGDGWGGTVELAEAPEPGRVVVITRKTPVVQEADFVNQGTFFADTHEEQFDRLTCEIQDIQEALGRTLAIPETSEDDPSDVLATVLETHELSKQVVGIAGEIVEVAGIKDDVVTVAGVAPSVPLVAAVSGSIPVVAGIADDVETVAGIHLQIVNVSGNMGDVVSVGEGISSVKVVANDLNGWADEGLAALHDFGEWGSPSGYEPELPDGVHDFGWWGQDDTLDCIRLSGVPEDGWIVTVAKNIGLIGEAATVIKEHWNELCAITHELELMTATDEQIDSIFA